MKAQLQQLSGADCVCDNSRMLQEHHDPHFPGNSTSSGSRGINPGKPVNTKTGGDQVEQSTTVVVNNVIYDVTRVFSGRQKAKELLKSKIFTEAIAPLRNLPPECYNGASGLAKEQEVI